MAIEQYFEEGMMAQDGVEEDQSPSKKCKSVLAAALGSDSSNACFDCNICLENAQDPVVTLCGHLYCWPCIYKWLHFQSISPSPDEQQQCPVCKAGISQSALVPLYGRGQSIFPNDYPSKEAFPGLDIPQRPQACGLDTALTSTSSAASRLSPQLRRNRFSMQSQQHQNHNFYNGYTGGLPPAMPSSLHPMVGMFGELVYGRVFGNSMYWYPNSYYHTMSSSPRVRRREMQAEKSLNRISIFLFCCFVLFLLLF